MAKKRPEDLSITQNQKKLAPVSSNLAKMPRLSNMSLRGIFILEAPEFP